MDCPTVRIPADNRQGYKIVNADDPRAAATAPEAAATPEPPVDIDAMGKADVRAALEAHGVDIPKGATVGTMRDMLRRVVFVGL